jgi:hypothetical protein
MGLIVDIPAAGDNTAGVETRPARDTFAIAVLLAQVLTFWWPPATKEDAFFTERLHGPYDRPRLSVF